MSIAANELRVGNWIITEDGEYAKITGVQQFSQTTLVMAANENDAIIGSVLPLTFKPVPLSSELLVKAGFKKDEFGSYRKDTSESNFHKPKLSGRWVTNKFFSEELLEVPFLRFDSMTDCYYVHQLQNLYFALTGTELTLNL